MVVFRKRTRDFFERPQVELKTMVLTNLEDKEDNNFCFLQELRQLTTPTPQPTIEFAPLIILGSSKPSQSKFEKK